jgi:hypothetical protein
MNPVLVGLQRQKQAEAARRAAFIRMEIAGDTGYLNPQMYTSYLTGANAEVPSQAAVPLLTPGIPNISGSPVYQKFPVPGVLPSDFRQQLDMAGIVPPAYRAHQQMLAQQQVAMIQAMLHAEAERQRLMSRYIKIF